MARFSDLPNEVVQDIIFWAFLGDQTNRIEAYLPNNHHKRFSKHRYEDTILLEFSSEQLQSLAIGVQSFSLSQLLDGCFIRTLLSIEHAIGGESSRDWQYGFRELAFRHQSNMQSLLALSKTCTTLYRFATPLLWKTLELVPERWPTAGRGPAYYSGYLTKSPHFGECVLDLNIRNGFRDYSNNDIDWGLDKVDMAQEYVTVSETDPSISAIHVSEIIGQWSPELQYHTLISMLPNLRVIRLLDSSIDARYLFRPEIYAAHDIPMPIGLQNVREVAISWDEYYYRWCDFSPVFALPRIETVYFKIAGAPMIWTRDRYPSSIPNGSSTVKNFIIDTWKADQKMVPALLRLPSGLESFTFNNGLPDYFYSYVSGMLQGLIIQRRYLRRVDIGSRLYMNNVNTTGLDARFWIQFSVLEELCIPINFLLFDGMNYSHGLKDSLPKSLTRLVIYAINVAELSVWMGQLEELFNYKKSCTPNLRSIRVEHWRRDSTREDLPHFDFDLADESVRNLVLTAKEIGIDLQVEMETPYKDDEKRENESIVS